MKHKGFTLIEFIVIISIFAIMAAVALFNFNGFRSNVSLNNLAHDIGLTIRQAQVFGWSNKSDGTGNGIALSGSTAEDGNPLRYAEGVFFSTAIPNVQTPADADNKKFVLYRKLNATIPQNYIDQSNDEVIDTIKVSGPNKIGKIASAPSKQDLVLDANHQITSTNLVDTTELSIAFTRPKPEAAFFGQSGIAIAGNYVGIYIQGDADPVNEYSHVVIVSRTGEIDVQ